MARNRKPTKREFTKWHRTARKIRARKRFPKVKKTRTKTQWELINLPVIKELEKLVLNK